MGKNKNVQLTRIHSDSFPAIPGVKRVQEFVEFARWCALPQWLREPKTQKEFADQIGVKVNQDTLTDWKKHEEFWPLVWQFLQEWMREHTPDIMGGLYEKVASGKGNASDVRLFLSLAGHQPEKSKSKKQKNK
ncbi:MAG: hypothetical protein COT89_01360 [Candidatus Colwellbacteria bacterium CG10_big_fil_rev_8_21_14_0_10_42_22]|uniref:Homeodomain phBC6A51-type domain-containing protein n=1 Tax=Candidatus Colwellbacteria bacterium CG10_big_fil_rev_8_21_14_0_10_42_22 TaxID=1974540 RepID=A0A2H0VG57_9BACT|nr:MAG: hypothetical protein COT89_01360 [Candidatus Colwellbacteria bacterium CG10_big_fil_rev_8_21_14_0_10_42_22]